MNMFMRLFAVLTGGRPMQRIGDGFWDAIGLEKVDIYRDLFGREWLATGPCRLFRVSRH
jgi:hypothetical protein